MKFHYTATVRETAVFVACCWSLAIPLAWPARAVADQRLQVAYIHDAAAHSRANGQGRNYWDAYLREMVDEMGLAATPLTPDALAEAAGLDAYQSLLVGGLDGNELPAAARANVERWVRGGGTLILLATEGFHELSGNTPIDWRKQGDDEFTNTASLALQDHPFTRGIHSPLAPTQRLLVFSDVRNVSTNGSVELARLFDDTARDTGRPAITARQVGEGHVFYFAFHVPQTLWVLHQGRPVDRDYDGDKYLRRSDAIVIRPHSIEVAYADELLLLLQNMIGLSPQVFVHQLPPDSQGQIPDALFHWGGDDEGSKDGIQIFASNWMKQHGLPYHINAMPRQDGTFGLTAEDAQRIRENGHEISLHFNFVDNFEIDKGVGFSRDDVLNQGAAFQKQFGQPWVCSVNHWTRWIGWTEPAKWMLEAGGQADNTFVHSGSPPSNPTNLMGFSFGTAFPFWMYDDWRGENARIEFLELPITAYECGYIGQQAPDFATIHKAVDIAAHYHQTMNMFFHPVYITNFPHCRAAIEGMLRYMEERGIRAAHCGNDELCRWWKARSSTRISEVTRDGDTLRFAFECGYPAGFVAKIPLGTKSAKSVTVNGQSAVFKTEPRFGQNWLLAAVPSGQGSVNVAWTTAP